MGTFTSQAAKPRLPSSSIALASSAPKIASIQRTRVLGTARNRPARHTQVSAAGPSVSRKRAEGGSGPSQPIEMPSSHEVAHSITPSAGGAASSTSR